MRAGAEESCWEDFRGEGLLGAEDGRLKMIFLLTDAAFLMILRGDGSLTPFVLCMVGIGAWSRDSGSW